MLDIIFMTNFLKNPKIIPVILAGGVGSRLWPLSREAHPKPFIKLDDGESLIQKAYLRALDIPGVEEVLTVTNRDLFFYTKDEYEQAGVQTGGIFNSFILEPFGRSSSAAIGLAAHYVKQKYGDDCILLIFPADHLIQNQAAFLLAINQAIELACQENLLVTFGIQPDSPQTGYGYIHAEGCWVKSFVEKPDLETAKEYLAQGNYFWNSGMFCLKVNLILQEMENFCPEILTGTLNCLKNASVSNGKNWSQLEISEQSFKTIPEISIDYAVFEKSKNIGIIACDIGWSDIGSWIEFGALHPRDKNNNHVFGQALLEKTKNCIVHGENNRFIATLGLNNLIIADTPDALLIADQSEAQNIKNIVSILKAKNHPSYKLFPTVHRPWGSYTVLQESEFFKLKRIEVKPGAALSLQSHAHRSEHWIVVQGEARVTNGDQILNLTANQSTYIPIGFKHRLENPENNLLVLIEVQCGDYLGEDDIVRYQDQYGRNK